MKKSKTTAWLLLAGGAVAEGVAVGMFVNADNDTQKGAAALVAFLGAGAIAGSFPFFIKAKKHKMMANALLYGEKPVSIAPGVVLPLTQSYGIRFTIPLAK